MTDMTTERAVDIVAAELLRALLENHGCDSWGDYPDIGEGDWESVLERAKAIVAVHTATVFYRSAYEHLTARAAAWERDNDGTR